LINHSYIGNFDSSWGEQLFRRCDQLSLSCFWEKWRYFSHQIKIVELVGW
jgi:hypothetical protein